MFRELSIREKLVLPFACAAGLGLGYVAHKSTDLRDGWFSPEPTPIDLSGKIDRVIEREVERIIKEMYEERSPEHVPKEPRLE